MPQYGKSQKDRMASGDALLDDLNYRKAPLSDDIHPEVIKSLELLDHYSTMRDTWADKFRESEQFRNGIQWTSDQVSKLELRGQNPIVVNRMHPAIETAKAILTHSKPQFRATGREDTDRQTAKVFSDLFQWVWDVSNGNSELKQAIDDYYVGGMGVLQAYQDPHADMGKGEVCIKSVYPLDVYIDPNSRDRFCRDAANIIVAKLMTDEEAQKVYPEYWDVIKNADSKETTRYPVTDLKATEGQQLLGDTDTASLHHNKREFVERYTRLRINMYHVYDPSSMYEAVYDDEEMEEYANEDAMRVITQQGVQYVTDPEAVAELKMIGEQTGGMFHQIMDPQTGQPIMAPGPEGEMAIPGSTTQLEVVKKGELIESDQILVNTVKESRVKVYVSVGNKLLYSRILPCSDYPVIPLMNIHNRNPYPESDVRLYKPLQEYINKIRSLIIAHASTSTNVKLLVPRGSVNKKEIESEWGRAGTAVIEFDAEMGQPVVAGPIALPNELFKNEADAKYDLEYGMGIFELMQGGSQAAPPTYRGTVAIDEYGQRRIKSRQDDVEFCLNQLAKVTIPLMQQIYTEEKLVRLIQPSGLVREVVANQPVYDEISGNIIKKFNDITTGKYDIIVVSGSTLPSNRWAQFEYYMQLYQAGAIDQHELLKKTEVVDVEGVEERMSIINQLQQQLQQAHEEIKKLSGDLQTAERESIHDKKKVEVQKFKSKLDREGASAKMATQLYNLRLNDAQSDIENVVKSVENEVGRS